MFKMVLVDDEYYAIEGMKHMLDWAEYGIEIVGTATDGTQGIEVIKECCADIIIADIRMQELDGLDMLKALREDGFKGKVIILSGYQDFEYARTAIDLKVDKYLTKPLDMDEFKDTISDVVKKLSEEIGTPNPLLPDVLNDVLREIDERCTENISLEYLAEKFFCSQAYLSKLFKKHVGTNYIDYLKKRRIEKAKELLRTTNMSVDEIVGKVGWQSSRRFREAFRRYEGVSPSEYRQRYKTQSAVYIKN